MKKNKWFISTRGVPRGEAVLKPSTVSAWAIQSLGNSGDKWGYVYITHRRQRDNYDVDGPGYLFWFAREEDLFLAKLKFL